jgi:hypothetical protein
MIFMQHDRVPVSVQKATAPPQTQAGPSLVDANDKMTALLTEVLTERARY